MTKEEIVSAFVMRLNGSTFEEIAEHFNVTKQHIQHVLSCPTARQGNRNTLGKCIYTGLKRWCISSGTSLYELFDKINCFPTRNSLYKCARGEQLMRIDQIREILAFTGLSFEEAFGEYDKNAEVRNRDAQ